MSPSPTCYGRPLPEEATVFESPEAAERIASRYIKNQKNQYRIEPGPVRSWRTPGWIIRVWPIGSAPISAGRYFLRVAVSRPRRRKVEP